MKTKEHSFRINVRISRIEYPDIVADLERFKGAERCRRFRLLLSTGLAAARKNSTSIGETSPPTRPTYSQSPTVSASAPETVSSNTEVDALLAAGLDLSAFRFDNSKP